jgi:hypothetical protein
MTIAVSAVELQTRLAALEAEVLTLRERVEYAETLAGIKRGLDEANRGLGTPLKQVDQQLRAKYGIARP